MNLRKMQFKLESKKTIERPHNFYWKQKNKQKIELYKMTNLHIVNCINMLKRNKHRDYKTIEYINSFKQELRWRIINNKDIL